MGRPGGASGTPQRLIVPGGPGQFGSSAGGAGRPRPSLGLDDEPISERGSLTPPNKYRPPPGFMDADAAPGSDESDDPQEAISRLRARAGAWHVLGKLLPRLYSKGLDTNTIAELTGLNPVEQNTWVVAGTVHESIAGGERALSAHTGRSCSLARRMRGFPGSPQQFRHKCVQIVW